LLASRAFDVGAWRRARQFAFRDRCEACARGAPERPPGDADLDSRETGSHSPTQRRAPSHLDRPDQNPGDGARSTPRTHASVEVIQAPSRSCRGGWARAMTAPAIGACGMGQRMGQRALERQAARRVSVLREEVAADPTTRSNFSQ
jgi:hypothetical protein